MDALKTGDTGLPNRTDAENAIRRAEAFAHAGTLAAAGLGEVCVGDGAAIESLLEAIEDQVSIIKTWFHKVHCAATKGALAMAKSKLR